MSSMYVHIYHMCKILDEQAKLQHDEMLLLYVRTAAFITPAAYDVSVQQQQYIMYYV